MSEHTPGPWAIGGVYLDDEGYREVAIMARVADGGQYKGGTYFPAGVCMPFPMCAGMQDANARLIAAAPDMLVQLKRLVRYIDDLADAGFGPKCEADPARAVIASASGERLP